MSNLLPLLLMDSFAQVEAYYSIVEGIRGNIPVQTGFGVALLLIAPYLFYMAGVQ